MLSQLIKIFFTFIDNVHRNTNICYIVTAVYIMFINIVKCKTFQNDISPLHLACHYDHPNVANLLLEEGASPHLASQNGHTPLHIAARKNQVIYYIQFSINCWYIVH